MPKANGKHYSYTRQFNGRTYTSSGRTFSKTGANTSASNMRNRGSAARVQRLGSSDRYAIYSRRK